MEQNFAYCLYLANDRDYKGVILVNYLIRVRYRSPYPVVCICLTAVSATVEECLVRMGVRVVRMDLDMILETYGIRDADYRQLLIRGCYYGKCLPWLLGEYSRVVYLDTDLLLRRSPDSLLEDPVLWAKLGEEAEAEAEGPGSPVCMAMAPDVALVPEPDDVKSYKMVVWQNAWNSGVMCFVPCATMVEHFVSMLGAVGHEQYVAGAMARGGDQVVFERLVQAGKVRVHTMGFEWNVFPGFVEAMRAPGFGLLREEPAIVHFYVRQKVWDIMDGTGTFMPFENLTHQTLTAELVQAYAECMRYVYCVFPGVQPLKYTSLITANK